MSAFPVAAVGLLMLPLLGVLILRSGLPVWALLLGVSSLFAAGGIVGGAIDPRILLAAPLRVVGLLDNDLLQALPLYVFIGVLLQHLSLADGIFALLQRRFRPLGGASSLAALGVGSLIAPMSGSVGSTASLLARIVPQHLGRMPPANAVALVSAASTIGVVVPPSLVLILLGDAMMRAHTEAANMPNSPLAAARIINTQDVLNAALLPASLGLVLWAAVAWAQSRRSEAAQPAAATPPDRDEPRQPSVSARQALMATATIAIIVALLVGVFQGKLFAVEAAATGGCLLLLGTVISRALDSAAWRRVLGETLTLSGALFALLVGATTFSLVFRAFGTDRWLSALALQSPLSPPWMAACILLFVAMCAWLLDAFEMIFVIVPIAAPALITMLGDAQQASVLLLLVLQLGFLLPPMGYALLMVRSRSALQAVATAPLLRALLPYLAALLAVIALVSTIPALVHQLDAARGAAGGPAPTSEEDLVNKMKAMSVPPPADSTDGKN